MTEFPAPLDPSFLLCVREWLARVPNPAAVLEGSGRIWWANEHWRRHKAALGEVGTHLPTSWGVTESPRLAWMVQDVLAGQQAADVRVGPLADGEGGARWYQVEAIGLPLDDEDPCAVVQVRAVDGLIELVHRLQHENEQMQHRLILLEQLSERDPVTGLLDQRGFERAVARELDHLQRVEAGGTSGLVRVRVEDLGGLSTGRGESLLQQLACQLTATLRPRDEPAALPNRDLVVLMPDLRRSDLEQAARRIGESVAEACRAAGIETPGIAVATVMLDAGDARVRDVLARSEAGLQTNPHRSTELR